MLLDDARALFQPDGIYLDSATYGLPPRPVLDAVHAALDDWRGGRTPFPVWDRSTTASRELFARLVGVRPEEVVVGGAVAPLIGLVAASLPAGSRVLAPDVEFTSNLFPWMVHAERGVEVRTVPLAELAGAVDAGTTLVAVSTVQSATGEVADLGAIVAAARAHGALVCVDATQACGWLPVDAGAVDFLASAAYKWLLSPRGTAFMTVRPEHLDRIRPLAANWYAGEEVADSYYGPPLRLAGSARRLDVSPAWFSWVGTRPALELILGVGVDAIHAHDVALADRFRAGLGLPPGDSAIVRVGVPDAADRLGRAGVRASVRAGSVRAAFHLYNTEADVDTALDALVG
jgi:selenocysteine lyase/cysteine desulfurase